MATYHLINLENHFSLCHLVITTIIGPIVIKHSSLEGTFIDAYVWVCLSGRPVSDNYLANAPNCSNNKRVSKYHFMRIDVTKQQFTD